MADFADALQTWDIEASPPDELVLDQFDLSGVTVYGSVQHIAD